MVIHSQTIRRLSLTNCFSVCDHFLELALEEMIHFKVLVVPFYTPWKHQKTSGFLIFQRGVERDE